VGFLRQAGPDDKQFDAFRGGLRAVGYVEGRNIIIEQRYAAGAYDRLPGLAIELVRSNVDVIVVDGTAAAKACKDATTTTPIVFTLAVDPVADGLVASIAHPGGNLTGLTMTTGYELAGKRLELLKDMVGTLSRVAVLSNPGNPPYVHYLRETERVGGLRLVSKCGRLKWEALTICRAPSQQWRIGAPMASSPSRMACCSASVLW